MSNLLPQGWSAGRFTVLLWILPCLLVLSQVGGGGAPGWRLLIDLLVSLALIAGVRAAGLPRSGQITAWMLGGLTILARWAHLIVHDARLEIAGSILAASFMLLAFGTLLLYVLRARHIDTDVVSAALCVYFLLGLSFGLLYPVVEWISPGSFVVTVKPPSTTENPLDAGSSTMRGPDFVYFSLVAMTTVGFGDIVPVSGLARALTVVEILIGQLYLVVMIARLVSVWHQPAQSR